jgi:hypothetical protein
MAVFWLALNLFFCGATLVVLATALMRLRGTTLIAPILWSMGAVSSIAIAEVVLFFPPMPGVTSWQSLVRYFAGTLTLLPVISILGAKRPQALVWNYIVASLWIVLLMPAIEVLLLKPQQTFEIYAFGPWMILGLIFYSAVHYAGTAMTLTGILVACAQIVYLSPHLPVDPFFRREFVQSTTAYFLLAAAVCGLASLPRRNDDQFRRLWAQFKSGYGTAWALRISQRLDELQIRHDWCVRLSWYGPLISRDGASPEQVDKDRRALARAFRSLMPRFLSARYLARFSAAELRQKPPAPVSTKTDP